MAFNLAILPVKTFSAMKTFLAHRPFASLPQGAKNAKKDTKLYGFCKEEGFPLRLCSKFRFLEQKSSSLRSLCARR